MVWSFWPELMEYSTLTSPAAFISSKRAAIAFAISSRDAWSSCLIIATFTVPSSSAAGASDAAGAGLLPQAAKASIMAQARSIAKIFLIVLLVFIVFSSDFI